jgi:hypothetical protein
MQLIMYITNGIHGSHEKHSSALHFPDMNSLGCDARKSSLATAPTIAPEKI